MYCTQCGQKLMDGSRVCPQCGSPAKSASLASASPTKGFQLVGTAELEQEGGKTPTSFKAAMDAVKAQSKRRIPMIIVAAIILSLIVSVALAGYYCIVDQYFSHSDGPTTATAETKQVDITQFDNEPFSILEGKSENESVPSAGDAQLTQNGNGSGYGAAGNSNPVVAAYEEVLDEYRAVRDEYLNVDDDAKNTLDILPPYSDEYPYVNSTIDQYDNTSLASFKYAETDLDDNDIPELIIGDDSDNVVEVYTYHDGEVDDLRGVSGDRDWFTDDGSTSSAGSWLGIHENGNLLEASNEGSGYACAVYELDDYTLQSVDYLSYSYVNDSDVNDSVVTVYYEELDSLGKIYATDKKAQQMMDNFTVEYGFEDNLKALKWKNL